MQEVSVNLNQAKPRLFFLFFLFSRGPRRSQNWRSQKRQVEPNDYFLEELVALKLGVGSLRPALASSIGVSSQLVDGSTGFLYPVVPFVNLCWGRIPLLK